MTRISTHNRTERHSCKVLRVAIAALLLSLLTTAAIGCANTSGFLPFEAGAVGGVEVSIDVLPRSAPVASPDGFEVVVDFEVKAGGKMPFRHIVQEIRQEIVQVGRDGRTFRESVDLVEAFRLSYSRRDGKELVFTLEPFQRDRHYDSGYSTGAAHLESIEVTRRVLAYPALVEGGHFTFYGFAHLPANLDGSVVTNIPQNFNRSHQERYQTRGRVVADARDSAREYVISYVWRRGSSESPAMTKATLRIAEQAEGEAPRVWESHYPPLESQSAGR